MRKSVPIWWLLVCAFLSGCQSMQIWASLQRAHTKALAQHVYIPDQLQYGVPDYWIPSLHGDCEDYALWMHQQLGGDLWFVRTKEGILHVVLVVDDYVIDSASPSVYPVERMTHKKIFKLMPKHILQYTDH